MIRIPIRYNNYSNCSAATEYSKRREPQGQALRLLGALITFCCVPDFIDALKDYVSHKGASKIIIHSLIMLCVAAFDFYAFRLRDRHTFHTLMLIFIDEEYRQSAVYGEAQHSAQFITECEEKRINARDIENYLYKKIILKDIIIYTIAICILFTVLFLLII